MVKVSNNAIKNYPYLVDVDWLKNHIDNPDIRIVDTRPAYDYSKGHIKNSVNIGLADIVRTQGGLPAMCVSKNNIEETLCSKGISNDTPVVAYDNFGGIFAARFLWTLEYFGHKNVSIFNGSIKSWIDEGEFTINIKKVKKSNFIARPDDTKLATKDWILSHLDDANVKLLDVRMNSEYTGKTVFGTRGGHIPGAVNLHWLEVIDPSTGMFRSVEDLNKMYEKIGIVINKEIVTYCWMGLRASHTYAILRLSGFQKVRVYDGSWSEWGEIESLPIER